jgi:large subunit ribosomal protein L3
LEASSSPVLALERLSRSETGDARTAGDAVSPIESQRQHLSVNTNPGIIGKKIGMTQVFSEDGTVIRCSVIESDLTVIGKRTKAKDGYDALIVGLGERTEKHTSKPVAGQYKKSGQTPKKFVRELRLSEENVAKHEVGGKVKLDEVFERGQFVDVQGKTRGRGFTGVMRRWSFAGAVSSHGSHEYKRHGGSIGTNMTPGRTLPGLKMPGHYGDETVSVLNLKVAKIVPEENLLLIEGGVPGSRNSVVVVKGAVKKKNGGKPKTAK